ncbi:MAG: outer membrane beta-barrel protein [Candidatus Symbiothrix sp.]|jgi:hypothetical protein|nr:outer membrane beta-barrel protein [Candidatus Symbiothrix sp.]
MKNIITLIGLLICTHAAVAQKQYGSEWRIHAGGGNSMFKFEKETVKSSIGGNLGVDYTYFFSSNAGLSTGLEMALYNGSLTLNDQNTEQLIETPPGLQGNFYLRTHYAGVEEKQTAMLLQLPLMLQVQVPISSKSAFYLGAGGKVGIPLSATYKQTVATMTTTGYSDYTKQTYPNMPNHGFETLNDVSLSDKLDIKTVFMLSAEAGAKWQLSEKNALYTGIYMDVGYAIGIKLGIAFGGGSPKHSPVPKAQQVKPQPLLGD